MPIKRRKLPFIKPSFGIRLILSLILCSVVFFFGFHRSENKIFWLDEGLEIMTTCAQPLPQMFVNGGHHQCSPNPFYYPFQKMVLHSISSFDESILTKYRAISLISMSLLMFSFAFWAFGIAGLGMSLIASVSFLNQETFQYYSAESRPYAMWLLIFLIWLILIFRRAMGMGYTVRFRENLGLWTAALALTLIAGSGMLQVGAGISAIFACWALKDKSIFLRQRKEVVNLLTLAIICGGIGLYYGARSCTFVDGASFDLLNTRDLQLVRNVVVLFISRHGFAQIVEALFVLSGLIAIPLSLLSPKIRDRISQRTFALGVVLYSQLLVTAVIAAAVAYKHYHFVPRVFIHLIICHALAIVLGGSAIEDLMKNRARFFRYAALVYGALALLLSVNTLNRESSALRLSTPSVGTPCRPFEGKLAIYTKTLQWHDYLNAVVYLNQETKRCGWIPGASTSESIWITGDPLGGAPWYERGSIPPPGQFTPLTQCGRKISLDLDP